MVTGRELIIYILSNGLEDEPVYKDGAILGFITAEEAARKFNVGLATIYIWVDLDMLDGVRVADKLYIPFNATVKTKGVAANE